MQNNSRVTLNQMVAGVQRRRKALALLCLLSAVVVLGVFWWLSQPAVTMTAQPTCGIEAHLHSEACYSTELVCAQTDPDHEHVDTCYAPILSCGLPEHEHSDVCYVGDPTATDDENAQEGADSTEDVQDVETPEVPESHVPGPGDGAAAADEGTAAAGGAAGADGTADENTDEPAGETQDAPAAGGQPEAEVEGQPGTVAAASAGPQAVSAPADLSDSSVLPSDVEPITVEGSSSSDYKINVSLKFVPVNQDGTERTDVAAPQTVRVKLDYNSSWGRLVTVLCEREIAAAIGTDEIFSALLCADGTELSDYPYVKPYYEKTVSGTTYLMYGTAVGSCPKSLTTPNAYFVVRYVPGEVTLALADANGAAIDGGSAACTRGAQVTIPAVEGYTRGAQIGERYFAGWHVEGVDAVYQSGDTLTLMANTTLVPYLSDEAPDMCAVTFNYQGPDGTAAQTTVNVLVGAALGSAAGLPDPACEGYRFDGWFDAQQDGNQVDLASTAAQGESLVLYARYTKLAKVSFTATDDQLPYINIQQWPVVYYIEPGTSLSSNGYGAPAVSVTNAGVDAGSGKASVYSWATADGLVCNADTVFDTDTELALQLFSGSSYYQLNFVCGCDGNHTVYGGSPAFNLGQRVAQPFLDAATAAAAGWTSEFCTEYGDGTYTVSGWYLKNTAGEMVELTPGVAITSDYLDGVHGNAVQVYARFTNGSQVVTPDPEPDPEYCTVKFSYMTYDEEAGEEVDQSYGSYTVEKGRPLSTATSCDEGQALLTALPVIERAGYFCDWVATTEQGAQVRASLDAVVDEDLVFTATFVPQTMVRFTYRDLSLGEDAPTVELANIPVREGLALSYTLDELPQAPKLDGYRFDGWYYKTAGTQDGTEETVQLTLESVLAGADVYVTAVYHEVVGYTLTVHDIGPDGEEMLPAGVASVDVLVPEGEQVLGYLDGLMLAGNTNAADVKAWYTKDADGNRVVFDPVTDTLTSDTDIYTYTYRVVLTVFAQDSSSSAAAFSTDDALDHNAAGPSVAAALLGPGIALAGEAGDAPDSGTDVKYGVTFQENTDGSVTITVVLRDGEVLKASDLIDPATGKDYSLYTWTKTNEDGSTQTVTLVGQDLGSSYTATGTNTLGSNVSTKEHTVTFYIFVNDQRREVASGTYTAYRDSSTGRHFLTPALLESVYGAYGFSAARLVANGGARTNSTYQFAHEKAGSSTTLWTTSDTLTLNGSVMVPILNQDGACSVYYLPQNTSNLNGGSSSVSFNSSTWFASNPYSFYSVSVQDPNSLIYSEDTLPDELLVLSQHKRSITLSTKATSAAVGDDIPVSWTVYDLSGTRVDPTSTEYDEEAQTQTITFTQISQGYVLMPSVATVRYDVNITTEPDAFSEKPTLEGVDVLEEVAFEGYVVRTPSPQTYFVRSGKYYDIYRFSGWAVNGDTSNIIQAGTILTADQVKPMSLVAQWVKIEHGTKNHQSEVVNFYVSLSCSTQKLNSDNVNVPTENFTDSVFAAVVRDGEGRPVQSSSTSDRLIYGSNDVSSAQIDAAIRAMATSGVQDANGTKYFLDSFPSDEQVFTQVRELQKGYIAAYESQSTHTTPESYVKAGNKLVYIGNSYVPAEKITSENFEVRWNVFKDVDDGFHVDGLLVEKQGMLTITKTFYGNEAAIKDVKSRYSITVTPTNGDRIVLNLEPETQANPNGYVQYDEATDTYTWVVTVGRNTTCTVAESNYQAHSTPDWYGQGLTMATLAEYCLQNSSDSSSGTWRTYNGSDNGSPVSVTIAAYPADMSYDSYQTVAFLNSYIPTNVMVIRKVDAASGLVLGQPVDFVLKKDGVAVDLWKADGTYYVYDPSNALDPGADVQVVENGTITVDASGSTALVGLKDSAYAGTYSLTEVAAPDGYMRLDHDVTFYVAVDENGQVSVTLRPDSNASLSGTEGLVLRITNKAETTQVLVKKQWANGETPEAVTLQLYVNGTKMEGYSVVLDGVVDESETSPWQHAWEVPLYLNGEVARYSVVETWIGSTAYDKGADSIDGFANYVVTYDAIVYQYADGTTSSSPSKVNSEGTTVYAQSAILQVKNKKDRGAIEFTKTDNNGVALPGATFKLFKSDGKTVLATRTSGEDGTVSFSAVPSGTYYLMREASSPAGYITDNTLYKVVIVGSQPSIYAPVLNEDGTVQTDEQGNTVYGNVPIASIKNYPASASVAVKKVDGSGAPLQGAVFEIRNAQGPYLYDGQNSTFTVSGSDATFTLASLPEGTYQLTEVSAPAGYYRMNGTIDFAVSQGKVTTSGSLPSGVSFDGTNIVFTVTNTSGSELPQTGGSGTLPLAIGGLLLMAASLLCALIRRLRGKGVMR